MFETWLDGMKDSSKISIKAIDFALTWCYLQWINNKLKISLFYSMMLFLSNGRSGEFLSPVQGLIERHQCALRVPLCEDLLWGAAATKCTHIPHETADKRKKSKILGTADHKKFHYINERNRNQFNSVALHRINCLFVIRNIIPILFHLICLSFSVNIIDTKWFIRIIV